MKNIDKILKDIPTIIDKRYNQPLYLKKDVREALTKMEVATVKSIIETLGDNQ